MELDQEMDAVSARMKELLEAAEAERAELEQRAKAAGERCRRIAKVLHAADPATRPEPKKRRRRGASTPEWVPREDALQKVAFAVHAGTQTVSALAEEVELHPTTVREALKELRRREVVRLAGKNENNAHIFEPMGELEPAA